MNSLQKFIRDGFVEVDIDNPSLHTSINDRLFEVTENNTIVGPNNEKLVESIPELSTEILYHPDVVSTVKLLLGENYIEHPHKEIFTDYYAPNHVAHRDWPTYYSSGNNIAEKNNIWYFNPWNLHHHCRYLHLFYYPIHITDTKRGTVFVPGSQYYNSIAGMRKYYTEPTRIRSGGKVVIANRDVFHMSSVPRFRVDRVRYMVKFVLSRTEEPASSSLTEPDSWDGIYSDSVYNYHWNWYHGKKFNFPVYDSTSYSSILEQIIDDPQEVVNFTYNMAGIGNSESLIQHIKEIHKERKRPREEVLSNILALSDCSDLLIEQVNSNLIWNKKAAFIDILANKAENFLNTSSSLLSDQWIKWLESETSGFSLRNLIYGAPLVCQGVDDALVAVVDRFKNPRLIGRGEDRVRCESMLSMLKLSKSCDIVPDIESELNTLSMSDKWVVKFFADYLKKKWF